MFTKNKLRSFLKYAIAAAILYLISAAIFIALDNYTQIYVLYIGNIAFAGAIVFLIMRSTPPPNEPKGNRTLIASGVITSLMGTVISCVAMFILLAIMKPTGYETISRTASELMKPTPALQGNGHALMFILFMDAVFGNLGAGTFVAFMLPNSSKITGKTRVSEINNGVHA